MLNFEKISKMSLRIMRPLSKAGSELISDMEYENKLIADIDDVCSILNCKRKKAYDLMYHLRKNKWFERIEKNKYMLLPMKAKKGKWAEHPFLIAEKLAKPYYISFFSALSFYGFTEQVSNVVTIAALTQKKEINFQNIRYQFIKLSKNKFFGYEEKIINNKKINIATKEKAILDYLDYCKDIGWAAKAISYAKKELDFKRLIEYAVKSGSKALIRRLGFLLEKERASPEYLNNLRNNIGSYSRYTLLSPHAKKEGKKINKWKLIKNAPDNEIYSWKQR